MSVTGRVFIKVNGTLQRSKPGAKFHLGGLSREVVEGDDGVHGFKESTKAPMMEFTLSHMSDTDLAEINDWTDVTATYEADSGKRYVMRNAWRDGDPVEIENGEIKVTLKGISAEEA